MLDFVITSRCRFSQLRSKLGTFLHSDTEVSCNAIGSSTSKTSVCSVIYLKPWSSIYCHLRPLFKSHSTLQNRTEFTYVQVLLGLKLIK